MKSRLQIILLFIVFVLPIFLSAQSRSVFDAAYFKQDNFEPPLRAGKGFNITDVYKQTRFCFTPETASPEKLVRVQNSQQTNVDVYITKTEFEYNTLKNVGLSGKVGYLNLFSLEGSKLSEWTSKQNESTERLIFVAKVDFNNFDFPSDPVLTPEAKALIDNKQYTEFINIYGTHYVSGVRKEASVWVVLTKTESGESRSSNDENEVNGSVNAGQFGSYDFGVKTKNQTDEFFSSGTFEVSIEINGPAIDKIELESQISAIIDASNDIDKAASIKRIITSSIGNISDHNQGIITQYYFTPFTLYGVQNIIWNAKKESQLSKVNDIVLQAHLLNSDIGGYLKPESIEEIVEIVRMFGFQEKETYITKIRSVYNSTLPNVRLIKKNVEILLQNLEKSYNSCISISCNPETNCCLTGDSETKLNSYRSQFQLESKKVSDIYGEAMDVVLDELSKPECEQKQAGVTTVVNKSGNPYDIYLEDKFILTINGGSTIEVIVPIGESNFRAEQRSGYMMYPTVNHRAVYIDSVCQETSISIGYED